MVHERGQRIAETLGELIGALGDEVAEEVRFDAKPEAFDGIEVDGCSLAGNELQSDGRRASGLCANWRCRR
jgi:hypothetical protein